MQDVMAILSAEKAGRSGCENVAQSLLLKQFLVELGLPYRVARGFYQGTEECSFVVQLPVDRELALAQVMALAKAFDQESILVVDELGNARLDFANGDLSYELDQWIEIPRTERGGYLGWTEIGNRTFTTTASALVPAFVEQEAAA